MDIYGQNLNFVYLRTGADQWVVGWGEFKWKSEQPKESTWFWVPDFFLEVKNSFLVPEHSTKLSTMEMKLVLSESSSQREPSELEWVEPSKNEFVKQVKSLKEGALDKVVPVVFLRSKNKFEKSIDPLLCSRRLIGSIESLYPYGLWTKGRGIVGRSPEVLIEKISKHKYLSRALAGTRDSKNKENLLVDSKEMNEHKFVIEDIEWRLKDFGLVEVSETREWDVGSMVHLRTDLGVESKSQLNALELTVCLHPTPALGVSPRQNNFKWLKAQPEAKIRNRFGAPFAVSYNDKYLSIVAIRNIQWNKDEIILGSGCGIIEQSQIDKEWDELKLKRSSVLEMLGL